jgi:integrase
MEGALGTRLTDKSIWTLPAPERGNRIYYDSANDRGKDWVPGFGLRVTARGVRSFILNYRTHSDVDRRLTIGSPPAWTVSTAREEAARLKQLVDSGQDPLGVLQTLRTAPTMSELCDRFIAEHLPKTRPNTQEAYGISIAKWIKPALGNRKVIDIAFDDVEGLHRTVTQKSGPFAANRILSVLAKMFDLSIRWRMRTDNPARRIERNPEPPRTKYLTAAELARLSTVLAEYKDHQAADIVRLLLLTGARKSEVLSARWEDIDLQQAIWIKPGHTTKQRTDHRMVLSSAAVKILRSIQELARIDQVWVFPLRPASRERRTGVDWAWQNIRKLAQLPNVRLHDLRHTFASLAVSDGASLPTVGALLGHTVPATTARYAHLLDDPLRRVAERVGAMLSPEVPTGGEHGKR